MREILLNALNEIKERERQRGISRFFVDSEVRYVRDVDCFAFIKAGKATIPKRKEKAIRKGLKLYGETELLRVALENEIKSVLKRERLRDNCKIEPLSYYLPAVAKIGTYENILYLDIKACFYSIYSVFGLDCRCKTKLIDNTLEVKSVAKGRLTKDYSELVYRLQDFKKERNSVVGLMSSCFTIVYRSGLFERQFYRSKILNLELRALICSILNALIYPHVADIVYWNVDGGFIREEAGYRLYDDLVSCGFNVRVDKALKLNVTCLGGWEAVFDSGVIKNTGHYGKNGSNVLNVHDVKNRKEILEWLQK